MKQGSGPEYKLYSIRSFILDPSALVLMQPKKAAQNDAPLVHISRFYAALIYLRKNNLVKLLRLFLSEEWLLKICEEKTPS